MAVPRSYYVTTPIYYVNDRPHIGHVYTSTLADVMGRYHRMKGRDVFFLTGTDEHAAKVVDTAREHGVSTREWADRNAQSFRDTFGELGIAFDDFIRTSEDRHRDRVVRYVQAMRERGDVYVGQYEGWYDPGQEEYVPDTKAKDLGFVSAISGRPLVKKSEKNWFFRLSAYQDRLLAHYQTHPDFLAPEARRNEIVARIADGLNDVPMSRSGAGDWGIPMPGDDSQTIYVWIDALFNYLTTVDTDLRRECWPPQLQLIAKDILWFHAAIWPAMLMALRDAPGYEWVRLPERIVAHSFWIREGRKMSKSLGNFVDLECLRDYKETFGLDALRYFLCGQGPMGTSDRDFAHDRFVDTYNSELANVIGNGASRVASMIHKYENGVLPAASVECGPLAEFQKTVAECEATYHRAMADASLDEAVLAGLQAFRAVDLFIDRTQPFRVAKDPARAAEVGTILRHCAEGLRKGATLLAPIMPEKMAELARRFGVAPWSSVAGDAFAQHEPWDGLVTGQPVEKAEPLFARFETPSSPSKK